MFYEGDRDALISSIEECFLGGLGPGRLPQPRAGRLGRILGLVCPHAGYVYSGQAAACAYEVMAADGPPDIAVLLGPNHYGVGASVAVSTEREWLTPLGRLNTDRETIDAILQMSAYAKEDNQAHLREHCIEVQLPFIQYIAGDGIRLVPITIAHTPERDAGALVNDLGQAIAKALQGKNAVIIASTDFTHYESRGSAQAKDALALDRIFRLDASGLIHVNKRKIDHHVRRLGNGGNAGSLQSAGRHPGSQTGLLYLRRHRTGYGRGSRLCCGQCRKTPH